jgi:hypothetical protein
MPHDTADDCNEDAKTDKKLQKIAGYLINQQFFTFDCGASAHWRYVPANTTIRISGGGRALHAHGRA